ncbi:hypothetical protein BFV98_27150 [Micromonospora sp. WMMB235]|nr:hypothetical protein BFV98_27150 [Micromonospora sp. WMMB235]
MDPCESREEALAYVNDGIPADGWWQLHTDTIFGPRANLSVTYKTKLMRDVYIRWVEYKRVIEAARHGDPQAIKRVEKILERVKANAESEGRDFSITIDDLQRSSPAGDGFSAL